MENQEENIAVRESLQLPSSRRIVHAFGFTLSREARFQTLVIEPRVVERVVVSRGTQKTRLITGGMRDAFECKTKSSRESATHKVSGANPDGGSSGELPRSQASDTSGNDCPGLCCQNTVRCFADGARLTCEYETIGSGIVLEDRKGNVLAGVPTSPIFALFCF